MCDYSLEMYGSRPAREGEKYVTTRFPSGAIGFASPGDSSTAVCLQCDTQVVLEDVPPETQARFAIAKTEIATFAQTDEISRYAYRDGLRLASGRFILLQELPPGVGAYVTGLLENLAAGELQKALESTS